MDITPIIPESQNVIQSYGEGAFTVNQQQHQGSLIVLPHELFAWENNEPEKIVTSLLQHTAQEALQALDLLLIGTGAQPAENLPQLSKELKAHQFHADIMTTGAACRTYNILLAEGRNIGAALIAV